MDRPAKTGVQVDAVGTQTQHIAIVGAGAAGIMATRRAGLHAFDHGAQYLTAQHDWTRERVGEWEAAGALERWAGRIGTLDTLEGSVRQVDRSVVRYVGTPGMNALVKYLATGVDVRQEVRVVEMRRTPRGWYLDLSHGDSAGPYSAVLVSASPSQSAYLVASVPGLAAEAARVVMEPVWAVMAALPEPLPTAWDGLFCNDGPLSWVARNNSKPQRHATECWVMHARSAWTRDHLEQPPDDVVRELLKAFRDVTGLPDKPGINASAHLWRFARATDPLHVGVLWSEASRVGLCGDWCMGSRNEGALLSGYAAAQRVLGFRTMIHQTEDDNA